MVSSKRFHAAHTLCGYCLGPDAAPSGAGASLGLHAKAMSCCGAKHVPETAPWGPLNSQAAPLASELQAASASGGGPGRAPPAGCAEATLAIIIDMTPANPTGASAASKVILKLVFRIGFMVVIP
jgi:hypothetical protein